MVFEFLEKLVCVSTVKIKKSGRKAKIKIKNYMK